MNLDLSAWAAWAVIWYRGCCVVAYDRSEGAVQSSVASGAIRALPLPAGPALGARLPAALRNQFGGHAVRRME